MVDGAFDPLHAGHIAYFAAARALGLPVLCNVASDAYVNTKHRPLLPELQRVRVIDALRDIALTHLNNHASFPLDQVATDVPRGRGRPPQHSHAFYRDVASEYAALEACRTTGISTRRRLAQRKGQTELTIANWVRRCRSLKYLAPTTQGTRFAVAVLPFMGTETVLEQLRPSIYVKGRDWEGRLPSTQVDLCQQLGIEVMFLDTVTESSTRLLRDLSTPLRHAPTSASPLGSDHPDW